MSYDYKTQKQKIFTEEGQRAFLKVRDKAHSLLKEAGAFKMWPLLNCISGDTWFSMALVQRMVELGEIREITGPDVFGQDRVFVKARE